MGASDTFLYGCIPCWGIRGRGIRSNTKQGHTQYQYHCTCLCGMHCPPPKEPADGRYCGPPEVLSLASGLKKALSILLRLARTCCFERHRSVISKRPLSRLVSMRPAPWRTLSGLERGSTLRPPDRVLENSPPSSSDLGTRQRPTRSSTETRLHATEPGRSRPCTPCKMRRAPGRLPPLRQGPDTRDAREQCTSRLRRPCLSL